MPCAIYPPRCTRRSPRSSWTSCSTRGRIYGYRYRPEGSLKAKAVDAYPGKILEARAFQVMIDNNLDFDVALYPYELVTYGESGQVFQNWMQYNLVKLLSPGNDRPPDPGGLFRPSARTF